MRWIVRKGLRAPRLMLGIAVVLIVAGVAQMRDAPVDVLPEFQPPTVEVQTEALGLSAAEVEEFITVPLEQDLLNGVAFLEDIRSASLPGLSSIEMVFEPGTDLLSARQVVQERLAQAQTALPNVQTRPSQMLQPLSSTSRVMMIAVSSDELSPIDLSLLMRWTVGPKLLGVPGVANVAVWGSRDRQLQVLVDPARLEQRGTSLQDVIHATANAQFVCPLTFEECSTPGTGGIIETTNQRVGVQYVPVTATPGELARVPVDGTAGPITLGDVATIAEDHQQLIGDAVGTDLLVVVQKFPDANTLAVTSGLTDALEKLRPGLADVRFDTSIYRPATYIETSTSNLTNALVIGGILAAIALAIMLSAWRRIVIAIASIAVALGTPAAILSLTHTSLNTMSIAGLVLALVVIIDEAVLAVDSGAVHDRRTVDAPLARRELLEATLRTRGPAAYALLITLVCLVPTFFSGGTFGAFFPSIATPYVVAILAAMAVALVITPSLTWLVGTGPSGAGGSLVDRHLTPRAARGIARMSRTPLAAAIVGAVLIVAGLTSMLTLDRAVVPSFKDGNLLVHLGGAPSTSLAEMQRVAGRVADELRGQVGVEDVGAHVGRAITSDQIVGTNAGQVWVSLDPSTDYDTTVSSIQEVVAGYPGLDTRVVTYPNARIDEVLPDADQPVVVRLYGQDFDVLDAEGEEIRSLLTRIDGVVEPQVLLLPREPTLEIEVDLAAAQEHGIRPGDVRRAASAIISGITVGSLFEDQKVFEVVVWGEPAIRSDLTAVDELLVETPDGDRIPLGDIANVRIAPSPTAIQHESVSRYTDIVADVAGRDVGDVRVDIQTELQKLDLPLEYHAEVQDLAGSGATDRRLVILAVAAALLTFLLLQVAVGSWRLGSISIGALLLVLAGAATAAAIAGETASLGTAAGLVVSVTVGARQILGLMAAYRRRSGDAEPSSDETVIEATTARFAPIMTTLVVGVVLLLLITIAGPIAGLEIVQPMAVAAIGGLVASTVACLVVLPGLYRRFGDTPSDDAEELSMDELVALVPHERLQPIGGGS
jgi:Cu/Ag efflux pump CusA